MTTFYQLVLREGRYGTTTTVGCYSDRFLAEKKADKLEKCEFYRHLKVFINEESMNKESSFFDAYRADLENAYFKEEKQKEENEKRENERKQKEKKMKSLKEAIEILQDELLALDVVKKK
jgi:hypothetical protein